MEDKPAREKSHAERFLDYVQGLVGDRGVMADLRHGFSRATEYRAWPHIARWCELTNERKRRITLTTAAGFAVHGRTAAGGNMGSVLRALALGTGQDERSLATFDGRFRRFLACSTAIEVCDHLPGVLRAAERKGIAVDFARLHRDLTYWNERVKVEWASEFWKAPQDQEREAIQEVDR